MKAMKAPKFWEKNNITAKLLGPVSIFYKNATAKRVEKADGYQPNAKVICVGNIVAGGAGKTPVALALGKMLVKAGKRTHFVSKGYGRKSDILLKVADESAEVAGDEPLLLSKVAPTWVANSRAEAAKRAENEGAEVILLDDGFQDPEIKKNVSFMVIDGTYGIGNGRVIPAGPLREPFEQGAKRADAIIVIGELKKPLPVTDKPVIKATLNISVPEQIMEEDVVAFCGIGSPSKFFKSLEAKGVKVVEKLEYPDHHFYSDEDFREIFSRATQQGAVVVTTEKDFVKVPDHLKKIMYPIKAEMVFEDETQITALLA